MLIDKKGYCLVPIEDRVATLQAIADVDEIIVGEYIDGSPLQALRDLKPDIYAKGGDRTPDNMVQAEIDVCEEIGCEIVYGIGDLLNSSTGMFRNAMRQFLGYQSEKVK